MNTFKTLSSVLLILIHEGRNCNRILLQKRKNTGFMDGRWDCAVSGHVEGGETMRQALVREIKEEINISVSIHNLCFAGLIHEYTPSTGLTYYNAYFSCSLYEGTPIINESNKCSELKWFDINHLPSDIIPERALAINNFLKEIFYDEHGW